MKIALFKALLMVPMVFTLLSGPLCRADYQLALDEFKNGNYDGAAALFQGLVEQSPSYDYGHYMLGLCHLQRGLHEDAVASFGTALEFNDEKFEYFVGFAHAQKQAGDYAAAVETLNHAEELCSEGKRHAFHASRGEAHAALSAWHDAINDLEIANVLRPRHKPVMERLAHCYYMLAMYEHAIPLLRDSIAIDASPALNYRLLAESLMAVNTDDDDANASEAFDAAAAYLAAKPGNLTALDLFGRAALADGRFDEAIAAFSKVLIGAPANCSARINFALALLAAGREENAEQALAGRESCDSLQPDVYSTLGMIQRTQRKYEEALENYEKAYALFPASSSYQAIKEIRHNIAVREFNMAADRQQADEERQERELREKIERWNEFTERE